MHTRGMRSRCGGGASPGERGFVRCWTGRSLWGPKNPVPQIPADPQKYAGLRIIHRCSATCYVASVMKERKVTSELRPFVNCAPRFSCQCVQIPAVQHGRCVYDSAKKGRKLDTRDSSETSGSSDVGSDILEDDIDLGDHPPTAQNDKERSDLRTFYVDSSENEELLLSIVNVHCATGHDPALARVYSGRIDPDDPGALVNVHRAALTDDVTLLPCLSNPVTANRIHVGFQGWSECPGCKLDDQRAGLMRGRPTAVDLIVVLRRNP